MGQTPKLLLPYPEPTDAADGPTGFHNLASAVEAGLVPATVTALPGTPYDGQEVYFLADATNGTVWHLRYRAAATAPYRWEFVGGSPLFSMVEPEQSAPHTSWGDLATVGPDVTVPLAGVYMARFGARISHSGTDFVMYGIRVGATDPTDNESVMINVGAAGSRIHHDRQRRLTITTAGTLVRGRYRTNSGTASYTSRYVELRPERVT